MFGGTYFGSASFASVRDGVAYASTAADSATLSDAIVKAPRVVPADTLALADALAKAPRLGLADTLALADAVSRSVALAKADSVAPADAVARAVGKALAETLGLADSAAGVSAYLRALADTVTVSDAQAKALSLVEAEALALTDTAVVVFSAEIEIGGRRGVVRNGSTGWGAVGVGGEALPARAAGLAVGHTGSVERTRTGSAD